MNERIYTIAEQVGATRWNDELNGNSIEFFPEQLEKFAELIVKECADIGDRYEGGEYQVRTQILAHFGVEE